MSVNILHHTIQGNEILKIVHMDQCPLDLDHTSRCVGHKNPDLIFPVVSMQRLVGSVVKLSCGSVSFEDEKHVHGQLMDGASRNPSDASKDHSLTAVVAFPECCVQVIMSKFSAWNQSRWSFLF